MKEVAPIEPQFSVPSKVVMTNEEYHAHPAIGSTSLKNMLRSPAHYLYLKENPEDDKPAYIFGRALHSAILEPHLFTTNCVVMPEFWGLTKKGERTNSPQATDVKNQREAWLLQNHGKTVITASEMADILEMARSVSKHKTARGLLTGGAAEESYFDQCIETGLVRKARPDFLRNGHIIVDVKTTQNAEPSAFAREIGSRYYHLSAAYYLDVVSSVVGQNFNQFIIVAIEKTAPYGVSVHLLDEGTIDAGRFLYKRALRRLAECRSTGIYPGYPDEILSTAIPPWMFPSEN
jgi:hypothetical protein